MRQKDFDAWNKRKKKINVRVQIPFFHERELWWCSLGINVGFEQDGSGKEYYRPILVLKGMSRYTLFAIPLTTSIKKHSLRPSIGLVEGKEACAILSQMRLIDAKRLVRKIGYLDKKIFSTIRKTFKALL